MPNFKKYYTIPAPPDEVYRALTNPLAIKLWTSEECEMSTEPDTEFSMWDGSICGMNLEFEEDKKIVQEWYFGELPEPSIVSIKLHLVKGITSLELLHTNIPEEDFEDICYGWDESYMLSLINFFQE
jgi:activator of HSP90 ATPase